MNFFSFGFKVESMSLPSLPSEGHDRYPFVNAETVFSIKVI